METPTKETLKFLATQMERSSRFTSDELDKKNPSLEVLQAHATIVSVASCAVLQVIKVVQFTR